MVMTALERDIASAEQIQKAGGYVFRRYGFGEESMRFRADIIREVIAWAEGDPNLIHADSLASIEPGGLPWGILLGSVHGKSVVPIRCQSKVLTNPDAAAEEVSNNYSRKILSLLEEGKGEKIAIFDDVVSSGKTIVSAINLLESKGFVVSGVSCILARGSIGIDLIQESRGIRINYLLQDER